MVLPWDKDFLSSETELSSKTILYASEGQNVNNVSRSIVKKILGNIDSKDYLNLPLEEIASQNFIFLYPKDNSDITDLTIFVNYFDAGSDNLALGLQDGESLIVEETFTYGNTVITAGESVLSLIENDASFRGSSVSIEQGVYFIRGQFVDVTTDKIVLDPYDSFPSYRVGLNIDEQLITVSYTHLTLPTSDLV